MNKLLIIFFFFTNLCINAQKEEKTSFVKSFTKVVIDEFGTDKKEEFEIKTTVVFNYGGGNDIKVYQGNEVQIFKSVSSAVEGKDNNGNKYQLMKVLDEDGQEIAFMLYDVGFIRFVYYTDKGTILGDIFYIP